MSTESKEIMDYTMDAKKQHAKLLLKNGQFRDAKQTILNIIDGGQADYKIFNKLGDVCLELKEYEDAYEYYHKSMTINATNPTIYIKLGNLCQNHFNEYTKAAKMYEHCLRLDPLNEECYFNFAKLLFKQNKKDL